MVKHGFFGQTAQSQAFTDLGGTTGYDETKHGGSVAATESNILSTVSSLFINVYLRQFVLLRRHISAPVLCDNITLNGNNGDNQGTQLWTGTVGHDLGCHLGPSSRGTLRCLAFAR